MANAWQTCQSCGRDLQSGCCCTGKLSGWMPLCVSKLRYSPFSSSLMTPLYWLYDYTHAMLTPLERTQLPAEYLTCQEMNIFMLPMICTISIGLGCLPKTRLFFVLVTWQRWRCAPGSSARSQSIAISPENDETHLCQEKAANVRLDSRLLLNISWIRAQGARL